MKFYLKYFLSFCLAISVVRVSSQGTCATAVNLGTPSTTQACQTLTNGTTGSAPCSGGGYGGTGGGVTYVRFCTNATAACVNFSITQGTASGNWAVSMYSGTSCAVGNGGQCLGNNGTGATFNTMNAGYSPTLTPNTCYTLRIWSANPGTFNLCRQVLPALNDYCTGATPIGPTPQLQNNFCMTAGSNGSYTEPPPGQFCAGSLENNAWYTFTTSPTCVAPCTVIITISNIICSGGGAGFQLGFWTGACNALGYMGCTSGAGGSLTVTITGLTPGQVITMGMDGNAGANCTYSISASNTTPVPIELLSFDASLLANKRVFLKWITATEKNNEYFIIERSKDGVYFDEIARVNGAKNSNQNITYSTYDDHPLDGISYYRLKQVNTNGTFEYSDLRAVNNSAITKDNDFSLIPNPASGEVYVYFKCETTSNETINICDNQGRIVLTKEVSCSQGVNNTNLDISNLEKGMYFVFLTTANSKSYKSKLVVN